MTNNNMHLVSNDDETFENGRKTRICLSLTFVRFSTLRVACIDY
jgi:hypothetical protein